MALKNIAVEGCTLVCQFGGTAKIETLASKTSFFNDKGVYSGPLTISVKGSSAGGASANATGVGTLIPTAQFTLADNKFVVLEGDKASIVVAGSTSSGSPTSGTEVVTIQHAGQSVGLGE